MHRLKQWLISATADEIRELVDQSQVSREYLYQITSDRRQPSAAMSGRIVDAAECIRTASRNSARRLPSLLRAQICAACADCPHAKKCKG